MNQSGHLNPSEEAGTVTSNYGRIPPNKHRGVGRPEQHVVTTFSKYTNTDNFP